MLISPELRKYSRAWKHYISMPCLGLGPIGWVSIDRKYLLYKDPHYSDIFVLPPSGTDHPSLNDLVFYTNCLAYDHDLPSLLLPRFGKGIVQPLKSYKGKHARDVYCHCQRVVIESLVDLKWGGLQFVFFRWDDLERPVDLRYSAKYGSVAKELSLYSQALRQFDPLSEFLHYYRVIESVDRGNGKKWIANNLGRIKTFGFGFLEFLEDQPPRQPKRRTNLFHRYRRRAEERLRQLPRLIGNQPIQDYLYHVNRCGIAHGKSNLRHYDFSTTVEEIWKDLYIIKLLARIAIEEKMGSGNLVRQAHAEQ